MQKPQALQQHAFGPVTRLRLEATLSRQHQWVRGHLLDQPAANCTEKLESRVTSHDACSGISMIDVGLVVRPLQLRVWLSEPERNLIFRLHKEFHKALNVEGAKRHRYVEHSWEGIPTHIHVRLYTLLPLSGFRVNRRSPMQDVATSCVNVLLQSYRSHRV